MRYALMRKMDISNGAFVGVSLFVQGCHFHCKNCFNEETWDFKGGYEWTQESKDKFLELMNKPYIKRVSILGGEPLTDENIKDVVDLMKAIKEKYPDKDIWVYTGYTFSVVKNKMPDVLQYADVIVDGRYIEELRDITLKFRGSSNQRIWVNTDEGWVDTTVNRD